MKIIRIITAAILVILMVAVLFYYKLNNPEGGNGIRCWSKALFNFDCVSCGGQRALYNILNGNFLEALRYNSFLVILSPFLAYLVYVFFKQTILGIPHTSGILYSKHIGKIAIFLILSFTILRNLPWYPFTLLAPPN